MQLMLGNVVLMKLDAFRRKRKVKDRWSEAEYMVICQVTNDVHAYKVRDDGRNIKITHCNRLFLVVPARDDAMPLGGSKSVSYEGTTWSALVELEGPRSNQSIIKTKLLCLVISMYVVGVNYCVQSSKVFFFFFYYCNKSHNIIILTMCAYCVLIMIVRTFVPQLFYLGRNMLPYKLRHLNTMKGITLCLSIIMSMYHI